MRAIITFHSIDDTGSVLSYSPASFASFLEGVVQSGIRICSLADLLRPDTGNGIALTFDDGMRSVFRYALPVIRDLGVPAHLFLTTGTVGRTNRWQSQPNSAPDFEMLDWDEIEKLHEGGVTIESHTHGHPDLRLLSKSEITEECHTANSIIEQRLARRPEYFAYPYGYRNSMVCDVIRENYRAAVTTEFRSIRSVEDNAMLPRLDSYYLQTPWLYHRLDSTLSRAYLSLRGLLRRLRRND